MNSRKAVNSKNNDSLVLAVALVAMGIAARLWFRDIPNFAPIASIALFSGFLFRSSVLAICVPLSIMAISDQFIGGYEPMIMVTVYCMLAAPIALRGFVRLSFSRGGTASVLTTAGCSLAASLAFFVVTNFAVWLNWYDGTLSSLVTCYVQALPFFRYTVSGDLIFASILFGSYAAIRSLAAVQQPATAASQA